MKQIWKEIGLALILGIMAPALVLHGAVLLNRPKPGEEEPVCTQPSDENYVQVLCEDQKVWTWVLEDYIVGVVLAEMPASFETEALKAQSVVARTYTMRAVTGKSKHENAAVCTVSTCCQAYRSTEEYLNSGGTAENLEKVRSAVLATAGSVLTYEGELIEATYFSCSGGSTEDAVAVWGAEVPYLVATSSPGEEAALHFSDTEYFSSEQLCEALGLVGSGEMADWFGPVTYTAGGGIDKIEICGKEFSGTELRKLLNLRSTAITFQISGDEIAITTRGFGHRVGMSQYGADAMALQGSNYEQILAHYYRGTQLQQMTD